MSARRKSTDYIYVHYTGHNRDIGLLEITRQHRAKGYLTCGFHYIITRSGEVQIGRHLDKCGHHEDGFNDTSLGICLATAEGEGTLRQAKAMANLATKLRDQFPSAEWRLGTRK